MWIAYPKRGSVRTGISYPEVLEEALCFGWVDGQVRSLGEEAYANRYTPRRPGRPWSRSNVLKVAELERAGRMHPAGRAAFRERSGPGGGVSLKERTGELDPVLSAEFRRDGSAWRFFRDQPPGYRRTIGAWVMSAKSDETRRRRLNILVRASRDRRRVDLLAPGRP